MIKLSSTLKLQAVFVLLLLSAAPFASEHESEAEGAESPRYFKGLPAFSPRSGQQVATTYLEIQGKCINGADRVVLKQREAGKEGRQSIVCRESRGGGLSERSFERYRTEPGQWVPVGCVSDAQYTRNRYYLARVMYDEGHDISDYLNDERNSLAVYLYSKTAGRLENHHRYKSIFVKYKFGERDVQYTLKPGDSELIWRSTFELAQSEFRNPYTERGVECRSGNDVDEPVP